MSRRFSHRKRNPWRLPFEVIGSSGVYVITNKATGRKYIGESYCCPVRWAVHISEAYLRKHHNTQFAADLRKYSSVGFTFEMVAMLADKTKREALESELIAKAKASSIQPYNIKN